MKKIIYFITAPWRAYKEHRRIKQRIKHLKDQDPFIYK